MSGSTPRAWRLVPGAALWLPKHVLCLAASLHTGPRSHMCHDAAALPLPLSLPFPLALPLAPGGPHAGWLPPQGRSQTRLTLQTLRATQGALRHAC